jgi:hypothetical protein
MNKLVVIFMVAAIVTAVTISCSKKADPMKGHKFGETVTVYAEDMIQYAEDMTQYN